MFIIESPVCCASAKVRALRVSASSWLCSAMTPAPQQLARSKFDQLDPKSLGDEGHRAVQLGGETARDAAGPVGDFDRLAHGLASPSVWAALAFTPSSATASWSPSSPLM